MSSTATPSVSRRHLLGAGAALAAMPLASAKAQAPAVLCQVGPPARDSKGSPVWMEMDQADLDAAYDQRVYAPLQDQIQKRYASRSDQARARLGAPKRFAYGETSVEGLDLFATSKPNAPIFVFVHGGAWLRGAAKDYAYPAEMFVNAGAHYIAIDFISVEAAGGDLAPMADQVRRAIAWTAKNAASFGGDAGRLYLGGHSSGGHLAGAALVTDWQKDFGINNPIKGALCMSGLYDMKAVRLSKRSSYVKFTDAMELAMSTQRHLQRLNTPVTVTYGGNETPEFQRQSRDFAAALKDAGKPVELILEPNINHFEICETLGDPYGVNGRAALKLMQLA